MKIFLCTLTFLAASFGNAACEWEKQPTTLAMSDARFRYTLYEQADNVDLWRAGTPQETVLETYRAWVASNIDNYDPYHLLRKQRDIFMRYYPDIAANYEFVISKQVGTIRDPNCIEKLLFAEHAKGIPEGSRESEFRAYILKHPTLGIKVYLGLSRVGNGTAPPFEAIEPIMARDLEKGFRLLYDIHSHPFFFNNPTGDIAGTTIPSTPDIVTFKREKLSYGLEGALITNGINVIELRAAEFDLFYRDR
jgi:hypothetical protein